MQKLTLTSLQEGVTGKALAMKISYKVLSKYAAMDSKVHNAMDADRKLARYAAQKADSLHDVI